MAQQSVRRRWIGRALAAGLAAAMLLVLMSLGYWQLDRARLKESIIGTFAARENEPAEPVRTLLNRGSNSEWQFAPVIASGRFVAEKQYLLDNRTFNGKAGYHVLTPFVSADGSVLVNRGWVAVGDNRSELPAIPVLNEITTLEGRLVSSPAPGMLLGEDGYGQLGWPRVVQMVDLPRMSKELELSLAPALVELDPGHVTCLACDWKATAGIGPERHLGYALQWFSLAAALVVLMTVTAWMEWRRDRD